MFLPPLTDILQRTFCIQVGEDIGTGFTVPVGDKLVIVTAKHIVEELNEKEAAKIGVFVEERFQELEVIPHFCSDLEVDVAILETPLPWERNTGRGLKLSSGLLMFGQDTYFLGFPYFGAQVKFQSQKLSNGFPFPLIKKATYSGSYKNIHYLDGHNNPGFSGGPVIFNVYDNNIREQRICGVISSYLLHHTEFEQSDSRQNTFISENSGIIEAFKIEFVTELIEKVFGMSPNSFSL